MRGVGGRRGGEGCVLKGGIEVEGSRRIRDQVYRGVDGSGWVFDEVGIVTGIPA